MRGTLAACLLLLAPGALSMSGQPSSVECVDDIAGPGAYSHVECAFYNDPFLPDYAADVFPASIIAPNPMPQDYSLRLVMDLHAYTSQPNACETNIGGEPGVLLIKNCASHYPSHVDHAVDRVLPMGWWGNFGGGNGNGFRLAESANWTLRQYRHAIDWAGGIILRGSSYGGTGSILQSMLMPQGSRVVSIVHANIPHTLFVKEDPDPSDTVDERGHYYRDPAVRLAWGDADPAEADFARAAASGKIGHIYYRVNGAVNDNLGRVDLDFFRICQQYEIACFGTWHVGGHNTDEANVNLPTRALFTAPEMDVKLNQILPVFTNSSANNWEPRGHYNLGLSWNFSGIRRSTHSIVVPLRYQQHTDLGRLRDQPPRATFDITLRQIGDMRLLRGRTLHWTLGDQSGETKISILGKRNVIRIKNLTLDTSDAFTDLVITVAEEETVPVDNPGDDTGTPENPTPVDQPGSGGEDGSGSGNGGGDDGSSPVTPPAGQPTPPSETSIVYTRQPRARTRVPGSAIEEAANWQHASDVARINTQLAESDLVLDDLNGNVTVIHNCTESPEICVAQEARVSPDGRRIVYSVGYGNSLVEVKVGGIGLGIYEIPELTSAQLWLYDVDAGLSYPIPNSPDATIDRQPEWLNNDTIVFASNAEGTYPHKTQIPVHQEPGRCFNAPYCVSQSYGYSPAGRSMHIWKMKIDGTDAHNLTPHEQMALSPAVMSNGDIVYSCWNAHANRSHDAATSIGPSTAPNKWWLCRMDGNGAGTSAVLNAHRSTTLKTSEFLPDRITGGEQRSRLRAVRSASEIFKEKLAVTNYYRANHVGSMGIIFGMDYTDPMVEGCSTEACLPDFPGNSTRPGSGRYTPSSLRAITPYGTDQDTQVRRDERNRALGKAGYPAPFSKSEYLITHARGSCYEGVHPDQANRDWHGGEPTCQKAIYKVKVPMVTDPFDTSQMEMIAGGDAWHAYDARAVVSYATVFDQSMPAQPQPLDESEGCYLQVVDARKSELFAPQPYNWMTTLYEQCNTQGCAVNTENPNFHSNNIAALTVYLPEMWDHTYQGELREAFATNINNMGHKSIAILGSAPLRADGSVKMQVPCETPLLMAGTDANGMSIAHDDTVHSLRQGETRTCHGCHDGHSEERAAELVDPPAIRFRATQSAFTDPALPEAKAPIRFEDVLPIFENHCQGCHNGMNNGDGLLYSRLTQDFEQLDWTWMQAKIGPRGGYELARPYTSKWVAKFARDSLLYWKCINQRADGRTDAQYDNDIDFGPSHPTSATAQECRLLGQWIDTGVQN